MNKSEAVDDFLNQLEHPLKAEIRALRELILETDPRIKEEIKWNAPSFYMREHFATFKLRPMHTVQVVLHTGAKPKNNPELTIDDPAGLLRWVTKDRCMLTVSSLEAIQTHQADIVRIVEQWLEQTAHSEERR